MSVITEFVGILGAFASTYSLTSPYLSRLLVERGFRLRLWAPLPVMANDQSGCGFMPAIMLAR
jgi:hypothetical protein